jgi:hypothetical protein
MNRRLMLALPAQVALAATGIAVSAHAQRTQATSKPAGPSNPLFPDDAEFWYETLRMFGADEYGASSFTKPPPVCSPRRSNPSRFLTKRPRCVATCIA